MKSRPTLFISGVSHEFASFRDAVEIEVQKKGCFAENQTSFAPDYHSVEEMLRRKLVDADAVIHIVGFRFGAEPNQRPADAARRSYTQMEFQVAREMGKPVYVFFSSGEGVRDDPNADEKLQADEDSALQLAHRDAVRNSNHLYYFFGDKAELCKLVAEIPPVQGAGFHADISRIDRYAPAELIGRDEELALLNDAWAKVRRAEMPRARVLTFVALGGEGKTSLLAKWAAELAYQGWPGCDAVFAWSFFSQGTREQAAASSDLFLKEALTVFGDSSMANSAQGAFDKGRRLAQLIGERRALLILDGLEPLQYAPTSPTPGELKDQGVAALLKGLAANSLGLCVVTTRYSVPDLRAYWQATAPELKLVRLSKAAGVALLKSLGVKGTQRELETLVEDMHGHALTLKLLGSYLHDAHAGDIRKRDIVSFEDADAELQGGRAFRVMDAYARWFESEGEKGQRALAVMRLLGLFDRPATADCLDALLRTPVIGELTEMLVGTSAAQRNLAFTRLEAAKLLMVNRDAAGALVALDAHPLLREYFARQLRTLHPGAWRAGHRRLFDHLCATTKEGDWPTLEDLQPLYQAVAHGCAAGLQQDACDKIYRDRIRRGPEAYSTKKLGAYGIDLGAVACFFEQPWARVAPTLTELAQAWLKSNAADNLRALGRLIEAIEPMRAGLDTVVKKEDWKEAAIRAGNLSDLELTLGKVATAVRVADESVGYADRSGDKGWLTVCLAFHADALHQRGGRAESEARFREAEEVQREYEPKYPLLYAQWGFRYCELLLAAPERAAWQCILECAGIHPAASGILPRASPVVGKSRSASREVTSSVVQRSSGEASQAHKIESCRAVMQRASQTLQWDQEARARPLSIAFDHFILGRAALYEAILVGAALDACESSLRHAMDGFRRAAEYHHLPRGLLTRAWLLSLTGSRIGPESAQADLDEAWEIAERGPMPLFLADIHLHRARLFGPPALQAAGEKYPWESPHADLLEARRLIEKHGYWRRKEELEDAEAVAPRWPVAAA